MILTIFGVVLGILLLIGGGTALVTGASRVASRLGVSPMIVGLTIVGFGTSAPELVVNIIGSIRGETELAFGNVIGSNISNLGLVLGAAALIQTIDIHGTVVRREVPLLLLITTIIMVMALDGLIEGIPPRIGSSDSIILLLLFGVFIYITVQDFLNSRKKDALITEIETSPMVVTTASGRFNWLLIVFGFALLLTGGEITIRAAVALAAQAGVPTAIVGLFVVAVGTSMPELITSIIAAVRKESDLALGNILGSNIFNSLIVLPASGLVGGILIPKGGIQDLAVSWLFTAALIPAFYLGRAKLGRPAAATLLFAYFAYAALRVGVFSE